MPKKNQFFYKIGLLATLSIMKLFAQGPQPQLWYWQQSNLTNPQALQSTESLINQAASYGYTGVVFWDVSLYDVGTNFGGFGNGSYLQQAMNYAASQGLQVMASVEPFGTSNDILEWNPNWAEAQRVAGTQFQVNSNGTQLQLLNSFPGLQNPGFESGAVDWFDLGDAGVSLDTTVAHTGNNSARISNAPGNGRIRQLFTVVPWRQYHFRFFYQSQNFSGYAQFGIFDPSNSNIVRVTDQIRAGGSQGWTEVDYAFNSQASTQLWLYAGVYGGNSGTLWLDDMFIEETDLVYVTRGRAGTPLQLYDSNSGTVYQEGSDYNYISDPAMTTVPAFFTNSYHTPPAVTLPAGTRLHPGQIVSIDSYEAFPAPGAFDLDMCLTEPGVLNYLTSNAQALANLVPKGSGLFMSYDEMRQMNSCLTCKAKNMTPAQLLDWSVGQSIQTYQAVMPNSPLYVWSDMFDPYHNAVPDYFYVEGDLTGSWTGLPANVTVMNWNLGNLTNSLTWFSGKNPNQPIPHQQIIAGYYDSGNGGASAQSELGSASGIPGVAGFMYTTWSGDYSQLQSFANAARAGWPAYLNSLPPSGPIIIGPIDPGPLPIEPKTGPLRPVNPVVMPSLPGSKAVYSKPVKTSEKQ